MKKFLFAIIFTVAGVAGVHAQQTLAPPIAEFTAKPGKTVRGSFQVQNNSLTTETFEVEVSDMVLDKDGRHLNPLTGEHVTVTPSSGRLGPMEIRMFDYQIECDRPKCQVMFRVGMTAGHTKELLVKLWNDHAVYISDSKHPRMDALQAAGLAVK